MGQKPVKKSHFEGIKELDKINNYLVDADRDMFNFYQYFINFPKVYIQATQPSIPKDSIALWDNTTTGHRFWLWNTGGTQNALDFAAAGGAGVDHSLLSNLTFALSGHSGFQAELSTGNLTGASPISVGGGDGAIIGGGANVSIAQANTSQSGYISATDWGIFNAKADYIFGDNAFSGTGNFTTTGTLSGNIVTVNSANVIALVVTNISANSVTADTLSGNNLYSGGVYGGTIQGYIDSKGHQGTVTTVAASSANYSVIQGNETVVFLGSTTCNLLGSLGYGYHIYIKNVSTGNVLVKPAGSDTIDGSTAQTLYSYEGVHLTDYLFNWVVV